MSDEKNRDAARRSIDRDLLAQARAYTARLRAGQITPERARLDALLGDEVASSATGLASAKTMPELVSGLEQLGLWNADLRTLCAWYLARYAWEIIGTINRSSYYAHHIREDAQDFDYNINQWIDGADPVDVGIDFFTGEAEDIFIEGLAPATDREAQKISYLLSVVSNSITFGERAAQEGRITWTQAVARGDPTQGHLAYRAPRQRLLISSARWNRILLAFAKADVADYLLVYNLYGLRHVLNV